MLLQAAQVARLSSPSSKDSTAFNNLLERINYRPQIHNMASLEENVTLENPESRVGSFESWLSPALATVYWQIFGYRIQIREGDVVYYDVVSGRFINVVKFVLGMVATVLASLVPTLTILWLYHVQRTVSRIGITIGMIVLLGIVLRITTKANMKEIIGATAA
jgi:hypothetical protein